MAGVSRFEDLIAWQRARELQSAVYRLTRHPDLRRDLRLQDQLGGSALSITANIAEGFERGGPGEFAQYLSVAKASCGELRSHLYAALDAGYISAGEFRDLLALAEEVGSILGGLRAAVARRRSQSR
jgi:four helix bundle protein